MAALTDRLTDSEAMSFIAKVEDVFKSFPHLPKGVSEFFVKVAPYLAIIGAVLGLIGGPVVALFGSLASVLSLNPVYMLLTIVDAVIIIVSSVLLLMAFKPLKDREMKGWIYLFWSEVLSLVSSVVSLFGSLGSGNIIGALLGALIGFYILFEMKPFYGANKVTAKVKKMTE
jgi:hypothetical protein